MNRPLRLLLSLILSASSLAAGQTARSRFDPTPIRHRDAQKSFIDWTLSRINPADIDYGERIEKMRERVLDGTLRDSSLRIEAMLSGALCVLYICYWWECRKIMNLKVSTTRMVVAFQTELQAARAYIAKLSTQYGQAKRLLDERSDAPIITEAAVRKRNDAAASSQTKTPIPAVPGDGELTREEMLIQNNSLKQQVRTLTIKMQEEQQRNRKLKGQ